MSVQRFRPNDAERSEASRFQAKRSDGTFPDHDPAQRSDGVPSEAMASPLPNPTPSAPV